MSLLPMLCWLLLALPGVALVRRRVPAAWGGGPLAWLGIGWMASLIALAPVVVAGYLLRLPTGVVAVVAAGFVGWGAIELVRQRVWRDLRGSVTVVAILGACVVIVDAVLAERIGAILDNDARVHVARIRFLLDQGFSNVDPFVRTPGQYPYPLYHTNILHAVHAIVAWLTGLDPLDVWFGSLGASRLMIAGAAAWTAWVIVGGRWAPWIAAVLVVLSRVDCNYTLYPNQLAPWFAVPIAVGGVALVLARDGRAWHAALACAGLTLVVAMVHPLYAGFVLVMLLPALGCSMLWRWLRGIGKPTTPWACAAGLVIASVPMLVAVKAMTANPGRAGDVAPASAWERTQWKLDGTAGSESQAGSGTPDALGRTRSTAIYRQDGFTMSQSDGRRFIARDWGRGFTGGLGGVRAWRLWSAIAATVLALSLLGRPQAAVAVGAILVVVGVMSIPTLCTAAIGFLGAQWMVLRFEALATVLWCMLALPAMAASLERATGACRAWSIMGGLGMMLLAAWVGVANAGRDAPARMDQWWHRAMASSHDRCGAAFDGLVKNRDWMDRAIPDGAVLACGRLTGTWVAMLRGPALVCSERSSTGVPAGATRTRHVIEMLDDRTDDARRAELFRHYGVSHVLLAGRAPAWTEYWAAETAEGEGHRVIELLDAPDPGKVWEREVSDAMRKVLRGCADHAEPALEALVDERPQSWRGWNALGNAQWQLGRVDLAEQCYLEAQRRDPREPMTELMLGNCAEALGRPSEALARFASVEVIAIAAGDPSIAASATFNRGNALRRQGRLAEAESAYRRALVLDPAHAGAQHELKQAGRWSAPAAGPADEGDEGQPSGQHGMGGLHR